MPARKGKQLSSKARKRNPNAVQEAREEGWHFIPGNPRGSWKLIQGYTSKRSRKRQLTTLELSRLLNLPLSELSAHEDAEQERYLPKKAESPLIGRTVDTEDGPGKIVSVSGHMATVRYEDGFELPWTLNELGIKANPKGRIKRKANSMLLKRYFRFAVQGERNQTAVGSMFKTLREARERVPEELAKREKNGDKPIVSIKQMSGNRTLDTHGLFTDDEDDD